MGSSVTKNNLNTECVQEFVALQVPNWNTVEKIIQLQGTNHCSNWVEALYVAVEYLAENNVNNYEMKIILMSDFNEQHDIISQFTADVIAEHLGERGIQLVTIGEESLDERPASSMKVSEVLLKDLHKEIKGEHLTFDNAISDLRFYVKKSAASAPWYADLEFIDIKIPILSCIKSEPDKFPSWIKMRDDKKVVSTRQYLDRQRRIYEPHEIIEGYKYGETFIPVEKNMQETMSYKSGLKSYAVHSFATQPNIDLDYWYDNTMRVVLPDTRDEREATTFYSFVLALHNQNYVAIVRKIYNHNSRPTMVGLFPCIDVPDEPWCLVEICLPFAEDQRMIDTRPLKSVNKQLSTEQHEALDNLIDSWMMPESEDSYVVGGSQQLLPACVPNPAVQHRWHMLSHRALHPNQPLPPMEDYLKELLEVPSVQERSMCHLQYIAQLFELENIDLKAKQAELKESKAASDDKNNINTAEPVTLKGNVNSQEDDSFHPFIDADDLEADYDAMVDKY